MICKIENLLLKVRHFETLSTKIFKFYEKIGGSMKVFG
jgi:hypothetical protein